MAFTSPPTIAAPKRPNFLIILTDEERYPVPEESAEVKLFREKELIGRRWLSETGITFHNHYTAATACTPSRASLFTGQYPPLHGLAETYGFAKTATDPRIRWLEPGTVPTMGNLFQAAGYETVYKGKWHISVADLIDDHGEEVPTIDENGARIPEAEAMYLKEQPLEEYGFSDWIGPEPHGSRIENGGIHRDATFSEQVCEFLQQRDQRISAGEETKPFLMVTSLVNPHDVALFPQFKSLGVQLCDSTVPEIPMAPSDEETLDTKPSPQKKYVDKFESLYCPPEVHRMLFNSRQELRQMYYYLHKLVDQDIRHIYLALKATSFFDDTIVIFTSDHGDLLGAHGNMLQKWTVAYQEAIHIPLIISAPFLPVGNLDFVTSAVDLLPTMISLAGFDSRDLLQTLTKTHSEVHPLVGNDFSGILTERLPLSSQDSNVVYFMTEDEVSKGNSQVSIRGGHQYDSLDGPCNIETVICHLVNRETGERELWKYNRYYDDPQKWSHPFSKDICIRREGPHKGKVIARTTRYPDEYELYNLSKDPSELVNLAHKEVLGNLGKEDQKGVIDAAIMMASKLERTAKKVRVQRNKPFPLLAIAPKPNIVSKL